MEKEGRKRRVQNSSEAQSNQVNESNQTGPEPLEGKGLIINTSTR